MSIRTLSNSRQFSQFRTLGPDVMRQGQGTNTPVGNPWSVDLNLITQPLATPLSDQLQKGYPASIRALPGGLDRTPMLNSNHPEIVRAPGIAVSTFPWAQAAHQNHAFQGPFEIFTHHQNRSSRDLHQAVVLYNASDRTVCVEALESAAAVTRDAPYRDHGPEPVLDPWNQRTSGPGDRVASDMLRGKRTITEKEIVLAPGELRVVHALRLPPSNEGTSSFRFRSDGPVHAAVVIEDEPPTAKNVTNRLRSGQLLARNPDDKLPTPPGSDAPFVFGRVAGVQEGSTWRATLTTPGTAYYRIDDLDGQEAFILVGKRTNTFGTGQDHAAPLLTRYPDSAYAAHGNYGVSYDITIPIQNTTARERALELFLDSPGGPLPLSRVFRGTVAIEQTSSNGVTDTQWLHISQVAGDVSKTPITRVVLAPGEQRSLRMRLIYPANATPPHALRLVTTQPPDPETRKRDTFRQWVDATDQALTEQLQRWSLPHDKQIR